MMEDMTLLESMSTFQVSRRDAGSMHVSPKQSAQARPDDCHPYMQSITLRLRAGSELGTIQGVPAGLGPAVLGGCVRVVVPSG
jgi:hypothetical protein